MFLTLFAADGCIAAEKVALMLDGADPQAAPLGFNALCIDGLDRARKRYGKKIETGIYNARDDKSALEPLLRKAASSSDLVIVTSASYIPALEKIKKEFPGCAYVLFDDKGAEGIIGVVFREEEGGFMAGALAAMMTAAGECERINGARVIGIILGEDVPPTRRLELGYRAGARYISPGVRVICEYTGSFTDSAKAAEAAGKMTSLGADVIFCAAGQASSEVINGAEAGGFWCIGADSELEKEYPRAVLASVVKRSALVVMRTIERYMEDAPPAGGSISLGLAEGCVDLSTWTREAKNGIPADVREKIDEIAEKLRDGLIVIDARSYGGVGAD